MIPLLNTNIRSFSFNFSFLVCLLSAIAIAACDRTTQIPSSQPNKPNPNELALVLSNRADFVLQNGEVRSGRLKELDYINEEVEFFAGNQVFSIKISEVERISFDQTELPLVEGIDIKIRGEENWKIVPPSSLEVRSDEGIAVVPRGSVAKSSRSAGLAQEFYTLQELELSSDDEILATVSSINE